MKNTSSGVYFDGLSSTPKVITLYLDENNQQIIISNGIYHSFKWSLKDINFEKTAQELILTNKNNLYESIHLQGNEEFNHYLYSFAKQNKNIGWYQNLLDKGKAFYLGTALFVFTFALSFYFFVLPWIGERAVQLIPAHYDNEIGNIAYKNYMEYASIDKEKTKLMNDFAKELKFTHSKPLKFTVVAENEVNAFALPDGNIVIYSGILDKMKSYEELTALIGHEASHIHRRHSMKLLVKNLSGYIFISAILGDSNGILAIIGENANALHNLSYSRKYEEDADLGSFEIMKLNKINPNGIVELFRNISKEESSSDNYLEFISTHPITKNRIKETKKLIQDNKYSYYPNKNLETIFKELKK